MIEPITAFYIQYIVSARVAPRLSRFPHTRATLSTRHPTMISSTISARPVELMSYDHVVSVVSAEIRSK